MRVTIGARAHGGAHLLQRGAAALKLGARAAADEVEQARAVARGKQQHAFCARAVPPCAAHLLVVALRESTFWSANRPPGHRCDRNGALACSPVSPALQMHGLKTDV